MSLIPSQAISAGRCLRLLILPPSLPFQDAYYDYDVEVANDRFMKQRRRWHNGIFGGLLGRMGPAGDVWSVSMSPLRRAATMAVVIQQCIFVGQVRAFPRPLRS